MEEQGLHECLAGFQAAAGIAIRSEALDAGPSNLLLDRLFSLRRIRRGETDGENGGGEGEGGGVGESRSATSAWSQRATPWASTRADSVCLEYTSASLSGSKIPRLSWRRSSFSTACRAMVRILFFRITPPTVFPSKPRW